MLSQTGIGLPQWGQWALLALAIALLVLGIWLLLRRLIGSRISLPGQSRARQPRLGIVDIYDLDQQRQLVLLRRDNVEHLLLIGGPNDVVVESNIARLPPRQPTNHPDVPERAPTPVPAPARPPIEPPRPVLESVSTPERAPVAEEAGPPRAPEPPARDQAPPADPEAFEEKPSDAEEELAPIASSEPVQVTARPEPVLRAEPVPAPPRPAGPAFPPLPAGVQNLAAAGPGNGSRTAAPAAPAEMGPPRPGPGPTGGPMHSHPIPLPASGGSQPPRRVEKVMDERAPEPSAAGPARARPAPAFGPAPAPAAAPGPGPSPAPAPAPSPPAAGGPPSGPGAGAAPASPPGAASPRIPDAAILSDMTRQLEQALRRPSAPVNPDRPVKPEPANQAAPTPAAKAPDPFSVDEIEAEFARLLGRNDKG